MSKRDDVLEAVANVAYYGGLWHDMTEAEALEEIRALVYPWLQIGWLKKNEIGRAGYPKPKEIEAQ